MQPLLVVAAERITFGKKRAPVVVLRPDQVCGWNLGLRRVYSDEAVRYLSMVAEERSTWHATAFVPDDTLRLEQRFDRLLREVDDARVRRRRTALAVVLGAGALPIAGLFALGGIATALLGS